MSYDAPAGSACGLNRIVELSKKNTGLFEKACSSRCRPHSSGGSLKERYSQHIFKRPHTATNGRWLLAKHYACTMKTQALSDNQCLGDRGEVDCRNRRVTLERRLPLHHGGPPSGIRIDNDSPNQNFIKNVNQQLLKTVSAGLRKYANM